MQIQRGWYITKGFSTDIREGEVMPSRVEVYGPLLEDACEEMVRTLYRGSDGILARKEQLMAKLDEFDITHPEPDEGWPPQSRFKEERQTIVAAHDRLSAMMLGSVEFRDLKEMQANGIQLTPLSAPPTLD